MTRTTVATDEGDGLVCVQCGATLPAIPHALVGTITCGRCWAVYVVESADPPRATVRPEPGPPDIEMLPDDSD